MGFCLFEDASNPKFFVAVNALNIAGVQASKAVSGHTVLRFDEPLKYQGRGFDIEVFGRSDDVQKMLMQGAKIGMRSAEMDVMPNWNSRPAPLMMNHIDRIMAVRELMPDEFGAPTPHTSTASVLFFKGGDLRIVTQRPGIFAFRANADGKVPVLKADDMYGDGDETGGAA